MIKMVINGSPEMIEIKGTGKDIMSELAGGVIAVLHQMETKHNISINEKCSDWAELILDIVRSGHAEELAKALDAAKKVVIEDDVRVSRLS